MKNRYYMCTVSSLWPLLICSWYSQREKIKQLLDNHFVSTGNHSTSIPALTISRHYRLKETNYGVSKTALWMILQGEKQIWLSDEVYQYNADNYLFTSVQLPI